MTDLTRRQLALFGATLAAGASSSAEGRTRKLDLDNPRDNLDAYIKTRSDVSGADAPLWSTGYIYSFIPGRKSEVLFQTEALITSRTVRDEEGYAWLNREALYFKDPKTGEVIDRWFNPFIEREVEVFHIRNSSVNNRYDYEGKNGPWHAPYTEHSGDVIFYSDLMFFGPSPLTPEEYPAYVGSDYYQGAAIYNHHVTRRDLENEDLAAAPATISWTSNRQWAPWMEMGAWAGGMIAVTRGKKLKRVEDAPPALLAYMEKHDPDYLRAPRTVDLSRTTFYDEFKKHVEARRRGGR